LVRNRGLKF
jgi:hypothetical protein